MLNKELLFRGSFKKIEPYFYILPVLVVMGIIIAYPFIKSITLSFYDYNFLRIQNYFCGLENYRYFFFEDEHFWQVMWNTFIWTSLGMSITYIFSLFVALMLNAKLRFRGFFQTLILIPWVIPPIIAGVVWTTFYDPNYGLFNFLLKKLGFIKSYHAWLGEKDFALLCVLAIGIWKYSPFYIISLLAGLKAIPPQLYEAASIDGASSFQKFVHITFPLLLPVTQVIVILGVIWKATHFDLIWMLTQGGPGYYSHIGSTYAYMLAILRLDAGRGAAMASLLTIFLAGFVTYFAIVSIKERMRSWSI